MSLKINKETDLQKKLIDTNAALGGFGFKLQDKYIKGKPDLWLKLPSGAMIFAEVKIIRNARYTITPEFSLLQLDYMERLTERDVPVIGLIFTRSPEGHVNFKISSYMELKKLHEKFNKIKYHISHFKRAHNLEEVIEALEEFFAGSTPQISRMKDEVVTTFFSAVI
jgi:hypothetical protein